jgi:NAD-dependent SIR2 family protein deacetylase
MNRQTELDTCIRAALEDIENADALLIGAGAGMGVDSGLPDFRGAEGFWRAYPPFRGRRFSDLSTPHWFHTDPALAWGFFGHRLDLYRAAVPHRGFEILRKWGEQRPLGYFVFTSNVDGQFQKAGFAEENVLERHGSIHFLQCTRCARKVWPADEISVEVDEATIRAKSRIPVCSECGAVVRPNILMFGDWEWDSSRHEAQHSRYVSWLRRVEGKLVVAIELGAGLAIPTVRHECEARGQILVRINPREAETSEGIALPMGAMAALERIDSLSWRENYVRNADDRTR